MEEERKNLIQDNKIEDNNKGQNEKKGRSLFYFVIAFAVIIIAIVGATYAYFTASTRTNEENSITTGSTSLKLGIETDDTGANYDLIPTTAQIAKYAYAMQKEIKYVDPEECVTYKKDDNGSPTTECLVKKKQANSTCIDDSGSAVCSTYSYTVINDNVNPQTLTMYLGVTDNQFQNLWFAVYTDVTSTDTSGVQTVTRTRVTEPKKISATPQDEIKMEVRTDIEESQKSTFESLIHPTLTQESPRKTYTVVLWIEESGDDQTAIDGEGKTFKGYIRVTSGDGHGVTGVIGQATEGPNGGYQDGVTSQTSTTTSQTTETTTTVSP